MRKAIETAKIFFFPSKEAREYVRYVESGGRDSSRLDSLRGLVPTIDMPWCAYRLVRNMRRKGYL